MNKLSKEVLTEIEVMYIPKEAIMSPLISQAKILLTEYNQIVLNSPTIKRNIQFLWSCG